MMFGGNKVTAVMRIYLYIERDICFLILVCARFPLTLEALLKLAEPQCEGEANDCL